MGIAAMGIVVVRIVVMGIVGDPIAIIRIAVDLARFGGIHYFPFWWNDENNYK
jgi:hypothetical protein